jgi:hypothetical protein
MRIMIFAALAVLGATGPAAAQFFPFPPPPPPRPYYPPEQRYYGPPPGYGYGGGYYQRPVVIGNICTTSRGDCPTRPRPEGSPCGCNIPGFGPKRGAVVGGRGW